MVELTIFNRHWEKDFFYNFSKKRELYEKVLKLVPKKYIISIVGLRRTGKTTIMKQIIDELISQNVPRNNILYYSFDEPGEIEEIMNEYLKISGKELGKEKVYIFLDEIQKVKNWQDKLKIYYDNYNIKFFISGSSSLFIRKKSESLAGRIIEFELDPLSFKEYLFFNDKTEWFKNQRLFSAKLKEEFESYLFRQFIEIINEDIETRKLYIESLARKIIFEDIPSVYSIEQPQVLLKLLRIISSSPGILINYKSLSSDLSINEKTLSGYIEIMEKAYLLFKIYNFSKNLLTSEKKLKKVYLKSTSFCISDNKDISKLVENCVITQLKLNFFWRRNLEVDGILLKKDKIIPLEIKYKDNIAKKDIKGIIKFMEKFKIKKGIVLTKNNKSETKNLIFVPVWEFLLNKDETERFL